eukprot:6185564-Pleurochrysis_carterae.AAC.2
MLRKYRVVLKEVLHVVRGHGGVDVLERERLAVNGDTHDLAANAAEAVHAKLDGRISTTHGDGRDIGRGRNEDRDDSHDSANSNPSGTNFSQA